MKQPNGSVKPGMKTTNVRHSGDTLLAQLDRLRNLMADGCRHSFEVGDLVEQITSQHGKTIKFVAETLGLSRTRLCELRRTAVAFPPSTRNRRADFHFYTMAARCSSRLDMKPEAVLDVILNKKLRSTRQVSRYLSDRVREKERAASAKSMPWLLAGNSEHINRCHHARFQDVLPLVSDRSVKLVIADPPYGRQDRCAANSVTHRDCDNEDAAAAKDAILDLLRLVLSKLSAGGCLILFRPGSTLDPAWLSQAIENNGFQCDAALTWFKNKTKPGRLTAPYGISSERVLVLSRFGDKLINHDRSSRSDVLAHRPIWPRAGRHVHHCFEKPLALMTDLISKHTHSGDLVFEPFGGTGAATRAAIELGRRWIYCESNKNNFSHASTMINGGKSQKSQAVSRAG